VAFGAGLPTFGHLPLSVERKKGENLHLFRSVWPFDAERPLLAHRASAHPIVWRLPMRTFRPDWMLLLTVVTAVFSALLMSWL
jgi:hypothetical protein